MGKNNFYIGCVVGGRGKASSVLGSHCEYLAPYLGFHPFSGSLNIVMEKPIILDQNKAISFDNGKRFLWKVQCDDISVPIYVYRWVGCPLHVIELVSNIQLRKYFNLSENSLFGVYIEHDIQHNVKLFNRISWCFLWKGRVTWYYRNEFYKKIVYGSKLVCLASQGEEISFFNMLYKLKRCLFKKK